MQGYRAARVFDGTGWIGRPTLLVDDGRIVEVGGQLPASAEVVDLGDATLLPGLIDCHQHLVWDGSASLHDQTVGCTDDELADRAVRHARRALEAGVTTVRDLGDRGFVTLRLRGRDDVAHVLSSGPPITSPGGHCWFLGGEVADRGELVAAVAERAARGCDVVKIMVTGGFGTPTNPPWSSQFGIGDVVTAVDEAHRHGLPVAAHCHGVAGIEAAVDAGVDTIEHCSFATEELDARPTPGLVERLAASGVAVSATWGRSGPVPPEVPRQLVEFMGRAADVIGEVHRAGGTVVVGTDAGIVPAKPHDVLPHAIDQLLDVAGMSVDEALGALTARAAEVIRAEGRGRLAAGRVADLLAVAGDPRTDRAALRSVVGVWKSGRRVVGEAAPRETEAPPSSAG